MGNQTTSGLRRGEAGHLSIDLNSVPVRGGWSRWRSLRPAGCFSTACLITDYSSHFPTACSSSGCGSLGRWCEVFGPADEPSEILLCRRRDARRSFGNYESINGPASLCA